MTLTNAIKKAKKVTGVEPIKNGQFYSFTYKNFTLQFAQNGKEDEATNFYTKKVGTEDDLMTDYFTGVFHDNLSQALSFISNYKV